MMRVQDQEERALEAAAEVPREECRQALEKIRRRDLLPGYDPNSRPARLERVLAYVQEHLYEPSLNIATACRKVGVKDPQIGGALQDYSHYSLGACRA